MIAAVMISRPVGVALAKKVRRALEIVLHIGAHRTGSTSFQHFARENARGMAAQGVAVWCPRITRPELLSGIQPAPGRVPAQIHRAEARLRLRCAEARAAGTKTLILSDENMMGTPQGNLQAAALYPGAGERLARIGAALQGQVARVVLSARSPDAYWTSLLAMTVARGHLVPGARTIKALVAARRGWRDVIADVACALPGAHVAVMPHEAFSSAPEARLDAMVGRSCGLPMRRDWLNRAPDLPTLRRLLRDRGQNPAVLPQGAGRWTPFDAGQIAALRESYADDLHWLTAGADGLAQLITWTAPDKTGQNPRPGAMTRGHTHEQQGRLA